MDLGIPYELWDTPSAEIAALKSQCEDNLEKYNDIIEQWYWSERERPLQQYLCRERMLEKDQLSCLDDPPAPPPMDYKPKRSMDEPITEDRVKDKQQSKSARVEL